MLARLAAPLFLAGLLAVPCVAQSQNQSAPDSNTSAPATTNSGSTSSSPKKVWTNEDIPSVKASADKRNQNSTAPKQTADPATVDRIRKSLQKLQSQLDDVNKKLKGYNDFMKGEAVSTGSREIDKGVNRVPVDQQIAQLQEKKKQLEEQIGDLYDEARKKGIDPGQLRDTASAGL
jgi:hypothetical protein